MKLPFKIRSTAFLYAKSIAGLKDILLSDDGPIQCEIVRKDETVYRAQIATIEFFGKTERRIKFTYKWVCKLTDIRDKIGRGVQLYEKEFWTLSDDIPHNEEIIHFDVYYLHKHRRVKIKCVDGIKFYILNPNDPARLVLHQGEYINHEILMGPHTERVRDNDDQQ